LALLAGHRLAAGGADRTARVDRHVQLHADAAHFLIFTKEADALRAVLAVLAHQVETRHMAGSALLTS
jgi:hypothetical protein